MVFPELGSGIHWYDIAIALFALLGAIAQFYGARLERRPCKMIKISYGVTLLIVFFYTVFFKITNDVHGVYPYALVLLVLNVLCGAILNLTELRRKGSICRGCRKY